MCFKCLLEIYKKFDGSIHPELNYEKLKEELQPKEDPQQSWSKSIAKVAKSIAKFPGAIVKFFTSPTTLSDESNVRDLPVLTTYLTPYYKFITGETESDLSPYEVIDKMVYIFESLIKSYFKVEGGFRYLLAADIKKVSIQ